jgi:dephospho-CoA kinase
MLRVGLTGGIGSGKSTLGAMLAQHGAVVIDADLLAREVVAPGTDGHAAVVDAFGSAVVTADGSLDRAALADRVFADPAARRELEAIIHPLVRARAEAQEASAGPDAVVVHDIPLLVEAAGAERFDVVVVVDVSPQEAISRLSAGEREMTEQQVRQRMSAQADRAERLAAADVVIDNTGSRADLQARADELWRELQARAARSSEPVHPPRCDDIANDAPSRPR